MLSGSLVSPSAADFPPTLSWVPSGSGHLPTQPLRKSCRRSSIEGGRKNLNQPTQVNPPLPHPASLLRGTVYSSKGVGVESSEFLFEPGCQARSSPPRKCHLMDNPSPVRPLAICRAGPARRGVQRYICACGSKGCLFVPHSQPAQRPAAELIQRKECPTPPHPMQSRGALLQPLFLNTACLRREVPFGEERSWGRDLRGKSEDYRGIVTFLSLSPSSTPPSPTLIPESGSLESQ